MAFLLENTTVRAITAFPDCGLTGRRKIKTNVTEITPENVKEVLENALSVHMQNAAEITYLWDYYRGKQDIRLKEKYVRENINNKVTVNRASEIVTFKTALFLDSPITYVSASKEKSVSDNIIRLNEFMRAEDKDTIDKVTVDWMHICGVAERLILPDKVTGEIDGAPFHVYVIDPREAFVIYSSRIGEKPMAGVIIQKDENDENVYTVYTETACFTVTKDGVKADGHILKNIPLIEYINNPARMGAFENVISLLNNINLLESNAMDSVQDFVNGFDVFQNCDIDDGEYQQLGLGGKAVKIKTVTQGMEAKVYRVASELSQSGVQQRVDDLTEAYLTICGMPNRNGGSSTSDNVGAVIFRDGHWAALSRAKDTDKMFKKSERQFLRLALEICSAHEESDLGLELKDIEIQPNRQNLNNLQSKTQSLIECLGSGWIHPEDAFKALGDMFGDKELAYRRGLEWHKQQKAEQEETIQAELDRERERVSATENAETVPTVGSGSDATEQNRDEA